MNDLPLHGLHESNGATFVEVEGWAIPASYGDAQSEYLAVRKSVGLIDRSYRGRVRATGDDRFEFLGGMLSNRVVGLAVGEGNHTTMSDPQGHTLADAWLCNQDDAILLETEPDLQMKLMASLERFLITEDVTLEDATGRQAVLGVHGPSASIVIQKVIEQPVPDLADGHSICLRGSSQGLPGPSGTIVVARRYLGEPGYDLWCSLEAASGMWEGLVESGASPIGYEASERLRIEAGIPRYGVDYGEEAIVLEAGLEGAVDFTKGCFIGQEPIAKMHYRGKPRRLITGLRLSGEELPMRGTPLLDADREVGQVTSSAPSGRAGHLIALGTVRRGYDEPGTILHLPDGREAVAESLPLNQAPS